MAANWKSRPAEAFEAEYTAGQALTYEQVLALALGSQA
jgi:hypothetical protein